ncbi:hypothetical protein [Acinetobacter baumannii]
MNFVTIMAMADDVTNAEVSEVLDIPRLDTKHIIKPGIYVQNFVKVQPSQ